MVTILAQDATFVTSIPATLKLSLGVCLYTSLHSKCVLHKLLVHFVHDKIFKICVICSDKVFTQGLRKQVVTLEQRSLWVLGLKESTSHSQEYRVYWYVYC